MTRFRMGALSDWSNSRTGPWLVTLGIILIGLLACKASTPDEASTQVELQTSPLELRYAEVQALHDEVMPARGKLIRLQRKVRDAPVQLDVKRPVYDQIARADSLMMQWMYDDLPLAKLQDSLGATESLAYLDDRYLAMEHVADSMRLAMERAEKLLSE